MKKTLFTAIAIASVFLLHAQDQQGRSRHFNLEDGIVIQGYDPVSYFQGKPAEGSKRLAFTYQGCTYYFSTAANREEFRKDPLKYEPQYGGWCAYAMGSKGEKVSVDPETYKITGGKLYLFYNKFFNNTLTSWNKNENGLKKKADTNWNKIFK